MRESVYGMSDSNGATTPTDQRQADVTPIVERRSPEPLPEWRRRAAEKVAEVGFVAVADLSRRVA